MAIGVQCGQCGKRFNVDDRFAGRAARCKHCDNVFRIPDPMAKHDTDVSALAIVDLDQVDNPDPHTPATLPPSTIAMARALAALPPWARPAPTLPLNHQLFPIVLGALLNLTAVVLALWGFTHLGQGEAAVGALLWTTICGLLGLGLLWAGRQPRLFSVEVGQFLLGLLRSLVIPQRAWKIWGALALMFLALFSMYVSGPISALFLLIGLTFLLIGGIGAVVQAFQEKPAHGLACLGVPLYASYYWATRWFTLRRPLGRLAAGLMLAFAGMLLIVQGNPGRLVARLRQDVAGTFARGGTQPPFERPIATQPVTPPSVQPPPVEPPPPPPVIVVPPVEPPLVQPPPVQPPPVVANPLPVQPPPVAPPPATQQAAPPVPVVAQTQPAGPRLAISLGTAAPLGQFRDLIYPATPGSWLAVVRRDEIGDDLVERYSAQPFEARGSSARFRPEAGVSDKYILSPNGDYLVHIGEFPKLSAQVWSFQADRVVHFLDLNPNFGKAELVGFYTPDRFIVHREKGSDHGLEAWDAKTSQLHQQLNIPSYGNEPSNIAISPDGKYVALIARSETETALFLYNPYTGRAGPPDVPILTKAPARMLLIRSLDPRWAVRATGIAFSPDSSKVAVLFEQNGNGLLVCWQAADGKQLFEHTFLAGVPGIGPADMAYPGHAFDWLSDGASWLVRGTAVLDVETGRLLGKLGIAGAQSQRMLDATTCQFVCEPTAGQKEVAAFRLDLEKIAALRKDLARPR